MTISVVFYGHFVASAVGATGLTVTADVWQVTRVGGSTSQVVTGGSATEIGDGGYRYIYSSADLSTYDYFGVLKTTGTADQKQVPALWSNFSINDATALANLDTTVSSRSTYAGADTSGTTTLLTRITAAVPVASDYTSARAAKLDNLDATVSSRSTYAGGDTSGTTTLLSRLTSGRATNLDNLDATISGIAASVWGYATRLLSSVTAIVNGVWDEAISSHQTTGTTGKTLSSAAAAGDPLTNAVPGSYASGTAGYVLGTLASSAVTVVSPVGVSSTLNLVYGDDYYAADGRALGFSSASWPSLTGSTVTFKVRGASLVTVVGTVLSASSVRVELSSANVVAIGAEVAPYDISAVLGNGHTITLVSGSCVVSQDVR